MGVDYHYGWQTNKQYINKARLFQSRLPSLTQYHRSFIVLWVLIKIPGSVFPLPGGCSIKHFQSSSRV
jgi:hypothetical protein